MRKSLFPNRSRNWQKPTLRKLGLVVSFLLLPMMQVNFGDGEQQSITDLV